MHEHKYTNGIRHIITGLFLIAACLVTGPLQASTLPEAPFHKAPHIKVQLIAAPAQAAPGQTFWVAVRQEIEHHWHTYWRNPGDSGTAPKMRWSLPKGVTVDGPHWPLPHKIKVGPLANYGYADQVLLLYKVTLPASWSHETLSLSGDFGWLVCKEECIPGRAALSLTLPVKPQDMEADPRWKKLFATYLDQLPTPIPAKMALRPTASALHMKLSSLPAALFQAKSYSFFPATGSVVDNASAPKITKGSDGLAFRFAPNEYFHKGIKSFKGVLVAHYKTAKGTAHRGYQVSGLFGSASATSQPTSRIATAQKTAPPTPTKATSAKATKATKSNKVAKTAQAVPITRGLKWYVQRARSDLSQRKEAPDMTFWQALLFALLGGVLLNLMPCVFPVLSIKIMHFVEQAEQQPEKVRAHGLAFFFGVVGSFSLLAGALIALRASGQMLGWGFQLQSPVFVWMLALLLFAMGLSLSGVFDVGTSLMSVGDSYASSSGYAGSFFTGVLATVVATPCTAPLMAPAIGWALTQPAWTSLLIFNSLGFGMALPYLLLSFFPAGLRWLPRPGMWMERLKQGLAFALYGAAVWLLWVLGKQTDSQGIMTALFTFVGVAFAAWIFGSTRLHTRRGWATAGVFVMLAGIGTWGVWQLNQDAAGAASARAKQKELLALKRQQENKAAGLAFTGQQQPFVRSRLDRLLQRKEHVFLNMTAAWCISCKVNERVALKTQAVQRAFRTKRVHYMVGDWTNQDPMITRILGMFKRSGVPLYVLFDGKKGTLKVLPQVLTPGTITGAVKGLSANR